MNVYYSSSAAPVNTRMPSTWQSWLLRVATFVAICASNWELCCNLYDMLYFYEYGSLLTSMGNVKAMIAIVGLIIGAIAYALYTVYSRFVYVNLNRQLFFCDKRISVMQYRTVADCAIIALCVCKSLLSLIWLYNPQYSTLASSIVNPVVALAIMAAQMLWFVRFAGKQNAWYIVSALSVWYCMPALFV